MAILEPDQALGVRGDIVLVGHQHDGHALLFVELGEQLHDLRAGLGIQIAGRLIGQDQWWMIDQGAADGHPLLLSAGKLIRLMLGKTFQSGLAQQLERTHAALRAADTGVEQRRGDIVQCGHALEQIETLKYEADALVANLRKFVARQRCHILAIQPVGTAGGDVEASQYVHQRGFTRTGVTHDGDKFAALDGQVDVEQHLIGHGSAVGVLQAVAFAQIVDADQGLRRRGGLGESHQNTRNLNLLSASFLLTTSLITTLSPA